MLPRSYGRLNCHSDHGVRERLRPRAARLRMNAAQFDFTSAFTCSYYLSDWWIIGFMGRALTAKQLSFARLVAQGVSKTEALIKVYAGKRSRATARVESCRLAKKTKVADEIRRLVCDRFPEAIDE